MEKYECQGSAYIYILAKYAVVSFQLDFKAFVSPDPPPHRGHVYLALAEKMFLDKHV